MQCLRYEGLDLAVLKSLFGATGPDPIAEIIRALRRDLTRAASGFSMNGSCRSS